MLLLFSVQQHLLLNLLQNDLHLAIFVVKSEKKKKMTINENTQIKQTNKKCK